MTTERRVSMLAWTAAASWAVSLVLAGAGIYTEAIVWRVALIMTSAVAVNGTLAWLFLRNMPPIAAVYAVARRAPCDCQPPTMPTHAVGDVVPMRLASVPDYADLRS